MHPDNELIFCDLKTEKIFRVFFNLNLFLPEIFQQQTYSENENRILFV